MDANTAEIELRNDCYGAMFPDILHLEQDRPVSGKAFAYELVRAGSLFRSDRRVSVDRRQWDDCVRCPEFEHCYLLSMGRLTLATAIENR